MPKDYTLCYKCKQKIKTHPRCSGCSILRHPKDRACTCKLSKKEFADIVQAKIKEEQDSINHNAYAKRTRRN